MILLRKIQFIPAWHTVHREAADHGCTELTYNIMIKSTVATVTRYIPKHLENSKKECKAL